MLSAISYSCIFPASLAAPETVSTGSFEGLRPGLACSRERFKYVADFYCSVTTVWIKSFENLSGDAPPSHLSTSATLPKSELNPKFNAFGLILPDSFRVNFRASFLVPGPDIGNLRCCS